MVSNQSRPGLQKVQGGSGTWGAFVTNTSNTISYKWMVLPEHRPPSEKKDTTMLEQLLKLYTMFMATGVTSPMPHYVGPPGSGKSTVFQQLADLLGVKLHVVNVSRISPLGLEGLEMPIEDNSSLRLLISELWTKAEEGDIYLFDEFLRGFPEIYNGLLDIFTSREVAGYQLPRVFIAGASNTTVTYDGALEDRLLHLPVPDPRKRRTEQRRLSQIIIDELGLHPEMLKSDEMNELMEQAVLPTFELLDYFTDPVKKNARFTLRGTSVRKLIGQAKLRQVECPELRALIDANNALALASNKLQYVFLLSGKNLPLNYESAARSLRNNPKLTEIQRMNLELNIQLIDMEQAKHERMDDPDDDPFVTTA